MGEYDDGTAVRAERSGRRTRARAALADLTLVVRKPGAPTAVRVFTADERADAQAYADNLGGGAHIESLP